MTGWTEFSWRRRVIPVGEMPGVDPYGWPLPTERRGRSVVGTLADQRHVPVLVLHGERGLGKTVALKQERAALAHDGACAAWVDLGACTDAGEADRQFERAFLRPPGTQGSWHVLLDGLDEGLNEFPALDRKLAAHLEGLGAVDREDLRLRISCRTARWPARLEDALRRVWRADQTAVMSLAPLSREDVVMAAEAMGVSDTEELTTALRHRGLIVLATSPIPLRQLLRGYTETGALPQTVGQAYRDACLHLCAETRRPNSAQQLHAQAAPEHLLTIASRVAAVLHFGSYTALTDQMDRSGAPAGDLHLSSLIGAEPGPLGGTVACTTSELRQITESGLLVPVGELRWTFAHRSYQEYLAALFLRTRALAPSVLRELLWIGSGKNRHVLEAHQEVAAWLAADDDTVFEDLLRDDPLVLLQADLSARRSSDRARAAGALLALLGQDDTLRLDHAQLHRLGHPALPDQLRPYLSPSTEPHLVYAAVSIAQACRLDQLNDALLDVAEAAEDLPDEIRRAAVETVTAPDTMQLLRIRKLAEVPSPEVVAAALEHLHPAHLSVTEHLALFRDPDPAHIGAAHLYRQAVPAGLNPETITEAVTWAGTVVGDPDTKASRALALGVLTRAITLAEDASVPADEIVPLLSVAFLDMAACEEDLYHYRLQDHLRTLDTTLASAVCTRRRLALHLLATAGPEQWFVLLGVFGTGLLPADDVLYWMEHWDLLEGLPSQTIRTAVRFRPPEDALERQRANIARAAHPSLAEFTAWWDAPPAEAPRHTRIAEEREHRRRRNTYDESDLRDALNAARTADSTEVRAAWARVLNQLQRTPDGAQPRSFEPLLTLADLAPSRPLTGSDLGCLLTDAALHVLRTAPVSTVDDLVPDGADVWRVPELAAFAVAGDPSQISRDPDRWGGWALALATLHTHDQPSQELKRDLLRRCPRTAEDGLRKILPTILDAVTEHTVRTIAHSLANFPDCRSALRSWAEKTHGDPERWHAVLAELSAAGDRDATDQLAVAVRDDPAGYELDTPARRRWTLACQTLLHDRNLAVFWPDISSRLSDPVLLTDFLQTTARNPEAAYGWPSALGQLPEDDLAGLYRLICEQDALAPLRNRPWRTGFVGGDDRVAELIQVLPELIARKESAQAAAALDGLAASYSDVPSLRRLARITGRIAAASLATPVAVKELITLADNHRLRLVRDEHQLLEVVLESLQALQHDVQGDNGTAVNLWNRDTDRFTASTKCWPCWEDDLCDAVTAFLRRDIGTRGIIINREVEIRRSGLPGQRTDIHIDAPVSEGGDQPALRLIIECKGCWNDELKHAIPRQLAAYLTRPRTAGLLLVGYFDCTRWNHQRRGCPATGHSLQNITDTQKSQAARLEDRLALPVDAFVLDCPLPGPESDWRKSTAT
jgi:hypothetical protein